jgi:anti-sigma-K factor RskA
MMDRHAVDIHRLAAAYALDALDDDERATFEAHYPACADCRADVVEFRRVAADLATAESMPPPPELRGRVLEEIRRTRQMSPRRTSGVVDLDARRARRRTAMLAAVAAAVLVVAGALVVGRSGDGDFGDQLAAVIERPDTQIVTLAGASGASGQVEIAWSPSAGRVAVVADGLGDPGEGRAWELWLIGADGPTPMRLLERGDGGVIRAILDLPGEPAAWGMTVEPAGGSPAPTGAIVYSAEV